MHLLRLILKFCGKKCPRFTHQNALLITQLSAVFKVRCIFHILGDRCITLFHLTWAWYTTVCKSIFFEIIPGLASSGWVVSSLQNCSRLLDRFCSIFPFPTQKSLPWHFGNDHTRESWVSWPETGTRCQVMLTWVQWYHRTAVTEVAQVPSKLGAQCQFCKRGLSFDCEFISVVLYYPQTVLAYTYCIVYHEAWDTVQISRMAPAWCEAGTCYKLAS